jgi:hypothetical protein
MVEATELECQGHLRWHDFPTEFHKTGFMELDSTLVTRHLYNLDPSVPRLTHP